MATITYFFLGTHYSSCPFVSAADLCFLHEEQFLPLPSTVSFFSFHGFIFYVKMGRVKMFLLKDLYVRIFI